MGVRINETGGDNQIRSVDDLLGAVCDLADLGDLAFGHGDIGVAAWCSGAIDDSAVLNK